MCRLVRCLALVLLAGMLPAGPAFAQEDGPALAARARTVLQTYCHRCHGKDGEGEDGFDYALDHAKLLAGGKVVPLDLEKSRIYLRATSDKRPMPPRGEQPRPGADDLDALKRWIAAGAPPFPSPQPATRARTPVGDRDLFAAVEADLRAVHPDHARYQRYFSFAPQHNDSRVSDADLRLYRAALSKLLNSLSWKRTIVLPRVVDPAGALLAIDLRDFDWDLHGLWSQVERAYPYGLKLDRYPADRALNNLAVSVYRQTDTDLPVLRADWFIATASQPPLYDRLLRLPATAGELERLLKVDVRANFQRDKLARAGLAKSNVSGQNRLIERHEAAYGAYWVSYDFKTEEGRGLLSRFPLGPLNLFPAGRHPFAEQAFEQAGGEIIFHLPNGLQAYLLVDGAGRSIAEAPSEVVRDKDETAGKNAIIVNGLSCMACHNRGMKRDFTETVRDGAGVGGDALDKVQRLYPPPDRLKRLLDADEELFLRALERAVGPFVKVGPDVNRPAADFAEPVGALVSRYLKQQLTLEDAARELGVTPDELRGAVQANDRLREVGLRPWAAGGTVSRRTWESLGGVSSPFQQAAQVLKRGDPIRER